jgi:hypothetical protein
MNQKSMIACKDKMYSSEVFVRMFRYCIEQGLSTIGRIRMITLKTSISTAATHDCDWLLLVTISYLGISVSLLERRNTGDWSNT